MDILAVDIGYGYTKGMTSRGQVILPSVVGSAEAIRFDMDLTASRGVILEVDGRDFFVGEQAILQSGSVAQTLDVTRTGSVEQKTLFYAVASDLVKTTTDRLVVVTGLPVADYDDRNRAALREMLAGEHTVTRRGKHTRRFVVEHVYIIPQAVGALYALILNRAGVLVDGDLAQGRVGVVDVGTLTTNFALMERLQYIETGSGSITQGMGGVIQKVAKDLKRRHGIDWGQRLQRVDQAIRARAVEVYGDRVNIAALVDPHVDTLADALVSNARTLWGSGADLTAVVLTGGGAHEVAPAFRKVYPHVRTAWGDPQFTNVTGYLRAGIRQAG